MSKRTSIIELLDKPYSGNPVESLHSSIKYNSASNIHDWLKGVIESLFYRPNHRYLVLSSEESIGKRKFLAGLFPLEMVAMYGEINIAAIENEIFDYLVLNVFEEPKLRSEKNYFSSLVQSDSFKITTFPQAYPQVEKRLASLCYTTNVTKEIANKRAVFLHVEEIDFYMFNSIDKLALWRQLFHEYKVNRL